MRMNLFCIGMVAMVVSVPAFAEEGGMKLNNISTDDETHIMIKKGPLKSGSSLDQPTYEIINDTDEITGEAGLGPKAGRAAWTKACSDWKAEMKEMNKDNKILKLNCGTPSGTQENGQTTFTSTGRYTLRVRVRDEEKK